MAAQGEMKNSSAMAYATNSIVEENDTNMIALHGKVAESNRSEHETCNELLQLVKIAHEMQFFGVFQSLALSVNGIEKNQRLYSYRYKYCCTQIYN